MGSRVIGASCLFALLLAIPGIAMGSYDYTLGDWGRLNVKGDITYGLKVRTEDPTAAWVGQSQGNSNFDKWDLTNNNLIATAEYNLDSEYIAFYGRMVGRLDFAYFDDAKYNKEQREHAAYNLTDATEFFLEYRYGKFTTRWGRQVVQWGENFAAVFTGVNEVSPMALGLVNTAGNPPRSTQVPTYLGWMSFRLTNDISLEAVWQPDFDPRYWFPVLGTFASTSDTLGWGVGTSFDTELFPGFSMTMGLNDRRPTKFVDKQQFGAAMRIVIPELNLLELGFYYYHYRSRTPVASMQYFPAMELTFDWPEHDMLGMSFNQAIQSILGYEFDWTISGELVLRPNDPIQVTSDAGYGYMRKGTLAWNIQFWKMVSNVLYFTPWNASLNPMIEFSGKSILAHNATLDAPSLYGNYWVMVQLTINDMIDNTKLELIPMASGGMGKEKKHTVGLSVGAKYGDSWGAKIGYTFVYINEDVDDTGSSGADRDALNFSVTYYW